MCSSDLYIINQSCRTKCNETENEITPPNNIQTNLVLFFIFSIPSVLLPPPPFVSRPIAVSSSLSTLLVSPQGAILTTMLVSRNFSGESFVRKSKGWKQRGGFGPPGREGAEGKMTRHLLAYAILTHTHTHTQSNIHTYHTYTPTRSRVHTHTLTRQQQFRGWQWHCSSGEGLRGPRFLPCTCA